MSLRTLTARAETASAQRRLVGCPICPYTSARRWHAERRYGTCPTDGSALEPRNAPNAEKRAVKAKRELQELAASPE